MPTGRQLYGQLKQSIRRQYRAGKTATQILNSSETKKFQKEYNKAMEGVGLVLNNYQLKRVIQRAAKQSAKRSGSVKRSVRRSAKRSAKRS